MGSDVYPVLGRINIQAIENRPRINSDCSELVLFQSSGLDIRFEDFTVADVPDHYDIARNYALFSWLSGVRGDLRPYFANLEERKQLTDRFLDWMRNKHLEVNFPVGRRAYGTTEWDDHIYLGDYNRIIFLIRDLLVFDYDQVAIVEDYEASRLLCMPDDDEDHVVYISDPEGATYREKFGDSFFEFLKFCQRDNWHFVIFGFD